ncbi:hypothetical protein M0802_001853 [Mischocyttarus mexicanus]|nr:hypothetical protein M0802_001853 [Mischocyttarus mexicanus]
MARLEFALTGRKVTQDDSIVVDLDDINIEEIDPVSSRIVYEDAEIDDYIYYRQSFSTSSFMTTYVRAIPKPNNLDVDTDELVEVLPEDITALDKFYIECNIAYVVYYDYFDINTIKKLVRLVIGDKSMPRTPSVELFGDDALKLLEERYKKDSSYKELTKKKREKISKKFKHISKESMTTTTSGPPLSKNDEEEGEMKVEDIEEVSIDYTDFPRVPKPGEDDWKWLDFPINPVLLDAMATLWENLEEIYIFDLMEIFSLKRTHSSAVIPYKDFLLNNMKEFINRPDEKQNLLQEFQLKFNEVSEDIRNDDDVKCELHCRLIEFQTRLWDICDLRRSEAEDERQRIIRENWTDVEAVILVNIYLSIIQTEIDRFVDTIQLIQDYYTSMLEKPIQESRLSKIVLERLNIHAVISDENKKIFDYTIIDKEDKKDLKDTKSKMTKEKLDHAKPVVNQNDLIREMANLFIDATDSTKFVPTESLIYKIIIDNINYVRKFVESVGTVANDAIKREENISIGREKRSRKKVELSTDDINDKSKIRLNELFQEWKYAIMFEINRIKLRLDIISASAEADVNFLLDTMRITFHRIYKGIIERYQKEKYSIDEMIKVFRFAIEEEKSIQEELILDGDDFHVRSNILTYPDKPIPPVKLIRETLNPFLFTITQLGRLMNVFKIIAPNGKLTERSLVYVIQDMISYNKDTEDDGFGSMPIPFCWRLLRSCDVTKLIEMVFGRCNDYIEWREFLIHAMNLPTATQEDILRARDRFRILDNDLKEIVTIDQYRSVPLWFFEYTDDDISWNIIKNILFDDFQRPFEHLFDDEIDLTNPDKLLGTMISEKVMDYVRYLRTSKINEDNKIQVEDEDEMKVHERRDDAEEALRLMLAKELLCQMYLIDRYSVNYTALLLAFCKDEDPREGLGKALSLAIGAKVCTDFEEGEKYVDKLLQDKRLSEQLESMRNLLREESIQVTKEIINYLLDKAVAGVIIEESGEYALPRRLMIQKLDEPGEIDPSTLLPQITSNFEEISDTIIDRSDEQLSSGIMPDNYHEHEERIERVIIYWLPYDICLAVLLATLPWHATQPDLFQTTKTLRELLRDTYVELYDEELSEDKDTVLCHRFLNSNFITELFESTSKFTVKRLGNLLSEIITTEEQERRYL